MKSLSIWILSVAASFLLPLQAMAQSVTVGSDSGVGGATLIIPVTFTAGADLSGIDLDINFDASQFSAASASCAANNACAGAFTNCSVNPDGTANIIVAAGSACVAGTLGEITLTIDAAATAGDKPLTVIVVGASDSTGTDIDPASVGITDGNVLVLGPAYASNPTPATGVDLGSVIQNDTNPMANVDISNSGAAGTTLTGICSESSDPDNVFSLSGDTSFSVLQGDPADTVVVTCDSSGAIGAHAGQMSCTHNGDSTGETDPALYALSCIITAGPQPEYTSVPAAGSPIALGPTEQNDQDPTADVAITNTGDIPSVLDGTCMIMAGGDPQITLTTDGVFSVADDAAADVETVSCDATAAPDTYNATLSCSHDGSNASPATYAVSCEITPPGQAKFRSDPEPGAVDMTPGDNPPVDDPPPTSLLTFFNEADPGDSDLNIACSISGNAAISVLPDISDGIAIAPDTDSSVTFSCDTASADSFSATYSCEFTLDGTSLPAGVTASLPAGVNGGVQQATYTYTCDVREAEADVVPAPAPGPMTRSVQPGGTAVYTVVFSEVADENEDGELTSCSLADGTNFTIISPALADFPVIIPAGGPSVTVTVEGMDPGDGSNPTDTLTCTYSDTANPEGTDAVYPLVLEVRAFSDVPIPTLGRYGLAILVLLMLGMGLLGFRRFS
jgi:hypothetical protein